MPVNCYFIIRNENPILYFVKKWTSYRTWKPESNQTHLFTIFTRI
jgi:hypothetical protein